MSIRAVFGFQVLLISWAFLFGSSLALAVTPSNMDTVDEEPSSPSPSGTSGNQPVDVNHTSFRKAPNEATDLSSPELRDGIREVPMKDIVVTATRKEMLIQDAPDSVTVIDAQQLEKSALGSVDDVLRTVAGVDIWGSNLDPLGNRAVTVRGIGGGSSQERTLILVDGIPINDSWSGSIAWNQVAKEDIERIEVVRGAASSLYGTNAMGGVINIITKVPQRKPFGAVYKGSYGSLDTWSTYGSMSGRFSQDKFGYYFSGKKAGTEGYLAVDDPSIPNLSKSRYDRDNLFGQFYWYPDQYSYLALAASHYEEYRQREFKLSHMGPFEINRAHFTYRRDVPDGISWLISGYGHDESQRIKNDDRQTHSFVERISMYDKPFYGFLIQPSKRITDWNILTAGIDFKYSEAEQNDTYLTSSRLTGARGKQQYLGFYLQDEIYLFKERLILIPGARYDLWRSFDGQAMDTSPRSIAPFDNEFESQAWSSFNPKFAAVYHLTTSTSLRGSIGKGFRAPSPSELYATSTYGLFLSKGNPNLGPEKVLSYEAGVTHSFGKHLDIRLTAYKAVVDDLIESRFVEVLPGFPPITVMQKDNISQVEAQGVEFEAYYRLAPQWTGFLNYTYNESSIVEDKTNPKLAGNWLSHSPLNKFNFGITYDNPNLLKGTIQIRLVGDSFDDSENVLKLGSYYTIDLFLSKKLGKYVTISLDVENILDEKYDIPSFNVYKAPGVLVSGALTLVF